jgi:hypothetical protein
VRMALDPGPELQQRCPARHSCSMSAGSISMPSHSLSSPAEQLQPDSSEWREVRSTSTAVICTILAVHEVIAHFLAHSTCGAVLPAQ